MSEKEAKSRIKINKLLEEADWRFFDDKNGNANIVLELNVKITTKQVDALGVNFALQSNRVGPAQRVDLAAQCTLEGY